CTHKRPCGGPPCRVIPCEIVRVRRCVMKEVFCQIRQTLILACVAAALRPAAPALAQPANDDCINAQVIACNSSVTYSNAQATESPSDPIFSCGFAGPTQGAVTTWLKFVATYTSAVLNTCDSTGVEDTLLAVYSVGDPQSPCSTLTEIACNDD